MATAAAAAAAAAAATAAAIRTAATAESVSRVDEVLRELERLGSAQTAKIYRRHGAAGQVFGVSYADLGKLKKRLKTNHALARDLWASGNHDARVLATMVADPAQATAAELDGWLRELDSHFLTGAIAGVAAQHPDAVALAERWMADPGEWVACTGWQVVAHLALYRPDLPDASFEPLLEQIEREIHTERNRVRDGMNDALIAIGVHSEALRERATAAARRIGTVHVDHGDTGCKTPDAAPYIAKAWARRAARAK
jgi:3-methyladenine DNA glycosylase AlkD